MPAKTSAHTLMHSIGLLSLLFIGVFIVENTMGDERIKFQGYCKTECALANGQRVGVTKTSELRLKWFPAKDQSKVTHVQFRDLEVSSISSGKPVTEKLSSSPIAVRAISSLVTPDGRMSGAPWTLGKDEQPTMFMQEFVDYRIRGVAVELDASGTALRETKFEVFLMRDYKSIPAAQLEGVTNWTIGPSVLLLEHGKPVAQLRDTTYSRRLGRILNVVNVGRLQLQNGEITFDELDEQREVYFIETVNERYEKTDGRLKRVWDNEKRKVDPSPFGYRDIYRRGYQPK